MRTSGAGLDATNRIDLRARRMRPRDAAPAAAMMMADLPMSPALAEALAKLLANGRLAGYCVERARAGEPNAKVRGGIVAFGLSGFLSESRAEAFLAAPIPHFAIDILERCLEGESASGLLGADAIARANADGGLNLTPICWLQRPRDRTSPEGAELMTLNMEIFFTQHRGYNLQRMIKEVAADEEARFVTGGLVRIKALSAGSSDNDKRVALFLTREQAEAGGFGSALGLLFASRRPRLGFTRLQQQVLEAAVDDLSDEEIADQLGLSGHAINMRWRTIYERIGEQPEIAGAIFHGAPRGAAAGGQKRRRVVAFARAHPEELRPFALAPAKDHAANSARAAEVIAPR
jgi:DNA-binding CsgD family transcriptional regulator